MVSKKAVDWFIVFYIVKFIFNYAGWEIIYIGSFEENLIEDCLLNSIHTVFNNREDYISKMENLDSDRSLSNLFNLIVNSA